MGYNIGALDFNLKKKLQEVEIFRIWFHDTEHYVLVQYKRILCLWYEYEHMVCLCFLRGSPCDQVFVFHIAEYNPAVSWTHNGCDWFWRLH